ncbi:FAD dependent oxidoreductase superfamily [Grosmannia clavigera kw1407]|uniref:FAD dependent oxidoreductase superfamily n=1 Tax=Grosmannia clavigera (strain kw1407 / UAMH 11150) TaxID=655863 RepID=F0XT06_GROCL|nr:FAD dependent oxidoreductase superfamily [Grosmannia clavigera kw1407]EFW99189.1 FAD dependent oxidoreductase superfamily [Grosmannia clavigera kw1407]
MTIREAIPGQEAYSVSSTAPMATPAGLPSSEPSTSYWLQKPSALLHGFRSTDALPATVDVAIVGSGITGAFAADALAEADGLSVLVLEAREFCYGATGRNGGHCQPSVYGNPADVADFELATFRFLRDFVATHNIPCDWRTLPGGGVHAYLDEDLFAAAAELVESLQHTRPDLAELAQVVKPTTATATPTETETEAASEFAKPTLESLRLRHAAGAVVQTHAASVWPYKLVSWVLERLARSSSSSSSASVNLQTATPVLRLSRCLSSGAWELHTGRGIVVARRVLLATNGYTSHLLPSLADLIVPVRGQVAALVPPPMASPPSPPQPVRLDYSYVFLGHDLRTDEADRDEYLVQQPPATLQGGHLILGGGRQRASGRAVGEWRDDAVEPEVATYLRTHLAPVLAVKDTDGDGDALAADYEWTGIMGFSRDQFPWVGEMPTDILGDVAAQGETESETAHTTDVASGLFLCAGYTGHGMPRAALAARVVATEILSSLGLSSSSSSSSSPSTDAVPLPAAFRVTAERIRHARAACATVDEADQMGLLADFRETLELLKKR